MPVQCATIISVGVFVPLNSDDLCLSILSQTVDLDTVFSGQPQSARRADVSSTSKFLENDSQACHSFGIV